ncbi:MAG: hypothetical protein EZS28_003777 [Streblomastix strix]|uniref:DUSP domain-containing protein n=1 Tax=Streblomastix strix TaxID=222440 RepID=A0A5J4X1T0_9EUKA|nr:MAG: hypothetical protein EZS28_003777 [Streblomastix strix]
MPHLHISIEQRKRFLHNLKRKLPLTHFISREYYIGLRTLQQPGNASEATRGIVCEHGWLDPFAGDIVAITQNSSTLPGPITNNKLLESDNVTPVPELTHRDYRGVNKEMWDFLFQIYGGGPEIKRRTLDIYED